MATHPLTWPAAKPTRAVIDLLLESRYPGVTPIKLDEGAGRTILWRTRRC